MLSTTVRAPWDLDEDWQARALCRGRDASLFFSPPTMERKEEREARESAAKSICRACPVRSDCLDFALYTREPYGVWGGMNELERRRINARRAG